MVLDMSSTMRLLIELLGGKEEAEREAWRLMLLVYGPLLKKAEFVLSLLSGVPSEKDITALKSPEAIIRELKKIRQELWEEKYQNWFE